MAVMAIQISSSDSRYAAKNSQSSGRPVTRTMPAAISSLSMSRPWESISDAS